MPFIEFNNVSIGFGSGTARSEVLKDINLSIVKGEIVAVLGFSGTGKSTLVNLLAGLLKPDSGTIIANGKEVNGPSPERGLVFQNYSLLPWFDVRHNIKLAVERVFPNESRKEKEHRVSTAIGMVNLTPAAGKKSGELSGGMRQRVSVARTLAMNPEILILDEPLSALDALTRATVQDEILGIRETLGQTILMITNDVEEALYMADRIVPLDIGPAATLGPITINPLPKGRRREHLMDNPEVDKARAAIISFLLDARLQNRSGATATEDVTLPEIRPIVGIRGKPLFSSFFQRFSFKTVIPEESPIDNKEDAA